MEKKQGFFYALKDEVVRGISPSRSRSSSPARAASPFSGFLRRKKSSGGQYNNAQEQLVARSGSLRPVVGETLTPLMEGPDPDGSDGEAKPVESGLGHWMKGQLMRTHSVASMACKRSDLRLLFGVMGAPLAPVHVSTIDTLPHLSIKDTPIETSSAQYILQQYMAASCGLKVQNEMKNAYAMGKVKMIASEFETPTKVVKNRNGSKGAESGGFVLWKMKPIRSKKREG